MNIEKIEIQFAYQRAKTKTIKCFIRIVLYAILVECFRNGLFTSTYPSVSGRFATVLRYVLLSFTLIDLVALRFMGDRLIEKLITVHPSTDESNSQSNPVQKRYLLSVIYLLVSELAAIYGLIIFYVSGGNAAYFYTFWFLSLVLTGIHFPRIEDWQDI